MQIPPKKLHENVEKSAFLLLQYLFVFSKWLDAIWFVWFLCLTDFTTCKTQFVYYCQVSDIFAETSLWTRPCPPLPSSREAGSERALDGTWAGLERAYSCVGLSSVGRLLSCFVMQKYVKFSILWHFFGEKCHFYHFLFKMDYFWPQNGPFWFPSDVWGSERSWEEKWFHTLVEQKSDCRKRV